MQTIGQLFDAYCSFCEDTYGGSHSFVKNGLGYDVLAIVNGHDHFQICLADKLRFGKYDLYHRNWGEKLGGGYNWHRQGSFYDIGFAIFMAYSHLPGKTAHFPANSGDYKRFVSDFYQSLYKN